MREAFESASRALAEAASYDERRAALERQIDAVRELLQLEPIELPLGLWDAETARRAVAEELRAPGPYTAWRLGWYALRLDGEERDATLTLAIDYFEKLVPTPVGPGNDDGPFCDIAHALSIPQARRALAIASEMHRVGWGAEASFAIEMLEARLARKGEVPREIDVGARKWNAWLSRVVESGDPDDFFTELVRHARALDLPDGPAVCGRRLTR